MGASGCFNLLYIDDNSVNVKLVSQITKYRQQINLHIATTADDGISKALEIKPQLILLDIDLPGKNGFEVYKELRTFEELVQVPVIFTSADVLPASIRRSELIGVADYLTKPLDVHNFLRRLDYYLDAPGS